MLHEDVLHLVCFIYVAVQSRDKIVSLLFLFLVPDEPKTDPFFKA